MAKVPDIGSDFAQKLLQDLRRRRERLGFESSAAQRMSNAAPRDAYSNSHKPLRSQKPQQRAPGVGRPEATTRRSYQQSSNAIVRAGKPRHRDAPIAHSHDIVPFQSGGGGRKQKPANNIDAQMALALALSNSGKLQNIELLARNGSIFFREASDYMEGSGNGKVLLLKGKENRKSSTHSSSAARLVEIVDEDSETEQAKNGRSSSNASMQIVAHKKSQSYSPKFQTATQVLQLSTVTSNSKSYVSKGEKDDSKVRMPSVIAKLMGLENLPSAKVVAERKGTEKFVKLKTSKTIVRIHVPVNAQIAIFG